MFLFVRGLLQSSVCVVLLRVVLMYYSMSFCVVSENILWAVNSLSFSEYIYSRGAGRSNAGDLRSLASIYMGIHAYSACMRKCN